MHKTAALKDAALSNADDSPPGVILEVRNRILWACPLDGEVFWFLDGRFVTESEAEAFLGGYSVDPRRIVDPGGSHDL
ncbi:hypothetical protein SBC1_31330 [Caballeronia sp. SBC1]|nr:hypothetical protein SBC1_31330 [Caballeronia sp. SBC1]